MAASEPGRVYPQRAASIEARNKALATLSFGEVKLLRVPG